MLLDKEIEISPSEWQMWLALPTTQTVMSVLADERSVWVQNLAFGETLRKPGLEIKETAETVGLIKGLTIILEDLDLILQQQWMEAQERKNREREEGEESEE